jgi:hypothetical protein
VAATQRSNDRLIKAGIRIAASQRRLAHDQTLDAPEAV